MEKEEFKKRRERLGLTQTELAKVLGFASNTVSGYETGRQEIPIFMELVFEALETRRVKELQEQK